MRVHRPKGYDRNNKDEDIRPTVKRNFTNNAAHINSNNSAYDKLIQHHEEVELDVVMSVAFRLKFGIIRAIAHCRLGCKFILA